VSGSELLSFAVSNHPAALRRNQPGAFTFDSLQMSKRVSGFTEETPESQAKVLSVQVDPEALRNDLLQALGLVPRQG
jgi:hypothetical protein